MTPASPQPVGRVMAPGRRRLLLMALALASAGGCRDLAGPASTPELFGRWDVVRACGGVAPGCAEPEEPVTITFARPDSAVMEVAGAVAERYRFAVVEDDETIYGTYDAIHVWRETPSQWVRWLTILQLTADSLRLGDNLHDGYTIELARVRP